MNSESVKNTVLCSDEINRFLSDFPYESNYGGAIFIHASILQEFRNRISIPNDQISYYGLHIGKKRYRMYLVWLDPDVLIRSQLQMIVPESRYSFPWKPNISIYTTYENYRLVETFITENRLQNYLHKTYTDRSRICLDADIAVTEFIDGLTFQMRNEILKAFRQHLEINNYKFPNTYFVTRAFKFLRPIYLAHYNNFVLNKSNQKMILNVIEILLKFDRDLSKQGKDIFNIFDLIAMKIAFDDIRNKYFNCQFHKRIGEKLQEEEFIKSNDKDKRKNKGQGKVKVVKSLKYFVDKPTLGTRQFHLNKYHSNMGILGYSEEVYQYLVTTFQQHFDGLKVFSKYGTFKIKPKQLTNIDNVMNESRYYKKLNIQFTTLNEHNCYILWKILTYKHLHFKPTLSFDTTEEIKPKYNQNINYNQNIEELSARDLHFKGKNIHNFIEELFKWMKLRIGYDWKEFDLRFIETPINDPSVLRGLTVSLIIIKNIKITCELLRALSDVTYEQIKFSKCDFENDSEIFVLLDNLKGYRYIQINIQDHTLQNLLDAITKILYMKNLKEYQFENYITIYYLESGFEFIDLSRFKFYISNDGTKLEAFDLYVNQTVNLYDYFYRREILGKEVFEFYN